MNSKKLDMRDHFVDVDIRAELNLADGNYSVQNVSHDQTARAAVRDLPDDDVFDAATWPV